VTEFAYPAAARRAPAGPHKVPIAHALKASKRAPHSPTTCRIRSTCYRRTRARTRRPIGSPIRRSTVVLAINFTFQSPDAEAAIEPLRAARAVPGVTGGFRPVSYAEPSHAPGSAVRPPPLLEGPLLRDLTGRDRRRGCRDPGHAAGPSVHAARGDHRSSAARVERGAALASARRLNASAPGSGRTRRTTTRTSPATDRRSDVACTAGPATATTPSESGGAIRASSGPAIRSVRCSQAPLRPRERLTTSRLLADPASPHEVRLGRRRRRARGSRGRRPVRDELADAQPASLSNRSRGAGGRRPLGAADVSRGPGRPPDSRSPSELGERGIEHSAAISGSIGGGEFPPGPSSCGSSSSRSAQPNAGCHEHTKGEPDGHERDDRDGQITNSIGGLGAGFRDRRVDGRADLTAGEADPSGVAGRPSAGRRTIASSSDRR
jgi:hypothetical protein